jgi:hypothetical protein
VASISAGGALAVRPFSPAAYAAVPLSRPAQLSPAITGVHAAALPPRMPAGILWDVSEAQPSQPETFVARIRQLAQVRPSRWPSCVGSHC